MYLWITILSFTVLVPFAVGIRFYNRIPSPVLPIFYLCALWSGAEIYALVLRLNGSVNAHLSYVLTVFEFFFFSMFYARVISNEKVFRPLKWLALCGLPLVLLDYFIFQKPFNTFSLGIEYVSFTLLALYFIYEVATRQASPSYSVLNFTLLFYLLSSFPYFFAWEWLRISDMDLLRMFGDVHAVVHAVCYQIIAYKIWRSSYSVQSSFQG